MSTYDQVIGIEVQKKAKAFKISDVTTAGLINDNVNGWSILVVADPKDGGVRIFRRFLEEVIYEFEIRGGKLFDKQTNSQWSFTGEAISGKLKGKTLVRPAYLELFYFAWEDFYPNTSVYKPPNSN